MLREKQNRNKKDISDVKFLRIPDLNAWCLQWWLDMKNAAGPKSGLDPYDTCASLAESLGCPRWLGLPFQSVGI